MVCYRNPISNHSQERHQYPLQVLEGTTRLNQQQLLTSTCLRDDMRAFVPMAPFRPIQKEEMVPQPSPAHP